jgi:glycoprotease/Kae1 family metallohydrolase
VIGMSAGVTIGIESTAHTFSFGLVDSNGQPLPSCSALLRPKEGGIHPREAADHHADNAPSLLARWMEVNCLELSDIAAVSYSQGPGLAPCLRVGASVARALSQSLKVPLVGVNHCVAHIEIGRERCGCEDPVLLYVSGGNTQVIARLGDRYRVLGETLDIGIGNMLDKFARDNGMPFPGGPKIEVMAAKWLEDNPDASLKGLELPYAVHGMDLTFSGLLTAAKGLVDRGMPLAAVCWSLQEHAFAACIEVAERALAHTGKSDILLGGGVACNSRLCEMSRIMAAERGCTSSVPEKMYCVDNGTMIARLGWMQLNHAGPTSLSDSGVEAQLRTDQTIICWP